MALSNFPTELGLREFDRQKCAGYIGISAQSTDQPWHTNPLTSVNLEPLRTASLRRRTMEKGLGENLKPADQLTHTFKKLDQVTDE